MLDLAAARRHELQELQRGLAALASSLDRRDGRRDARRAQVKELQSAVQAQRQVRRQRSSRRSARRGPAQSKRRPASAPPKTKRTVSSATGVVLAAGRNSLDSDATADSVYGRVRPCVHERSRPWRDARDFKPRASAEEIIATTEVDGGRIKAFERRVASETRRYASVIARSNQEWSSAVARPAGMADVVEAYTKGGRQAEQELQASVPSERILGTLDDLLGLEADVTGKWRPQQSRKSGTVRLRQNGASLLARTTALQSRHDTNSKLGAGKTPDPKAASGRERGRRAAASHIFLRPGDVQACLADGLRTPEGGFGPSMDEAGTLTAPTSSEAGSSHGAQLARAALSMIAAVHLPALPPGSLSRGPPLVARTSGVL